MKKLILILSTFLGVCAHATDIIDKSVVYPHNYLYDFPGIAMEFPCNWTNVEEISIHSNQLDAVTYNCFIQEQSLGIHYNGTNDLLDYAANKDVFRYEDGYVAIPDGPGLGVEIDEEYVKERAKEGHRWRNPIWRHKDGSFAEW